jgi:hypothetical protein
MNPTTSTPATATITCAYPGCGTVTPRAGSRYIDGCGQICPGCHDLHFGGSPAWMDTIEPPF